jgi:Arylsulfotransferase (ASST)
MKLWGQCHDGTSFRRVCGRAGLTCAAAAASLTLTAPAQAARPAVSVFPIPGSRLATPVTQIAFRGLPTSQFGPIIVTGSRSGIHIGRVLADSDGEGGSFISNKPFTPGEVVTVRTDMSVLGASGGTFQFTIATPYGPIPAATLEAAPRVRGDVQRFRSRPDLTPAALKVTLTSSRVADGDIFLAPQRGPLQWGPMIVDPSGKLVWFDPLAPNQSATNLQVQSYRGKPVLTWWQGRIGDGLGSGVDVIDDTSYRRVAVVRAANGLNADLHEFQITPRDTALITTWDPVHWDASAAGGAKDQEVIDGIVQEIDIPTGLVLFEWHSLDHIPVTDSYDRPPWLGTLPWDYVHINSIQQDDDGNLIVSVRHTSAAYKIDHRTGAIIWALGGKHSSFKMGPGARFAFQHDVRTRAQDDRYVTVFDDGDGPYQVHKQSRGLKLKLDFAHMTATRVTAYEHNRPLLADFEGNDQQLPNLDDFIGWGQQPYFSEFTDDGRMIFDGHFLDENAVYRAYRFPWSAQPLRRPAAVARRAAHGSTLVYASWNGATDVVLWRVLAGDSPGKLKPVATGLRNGFETTIRIHGRQRFFVAQALGSSGRVLSSSRLVRVGARHG